MKLAIVAGVALLLGGCTVADFPILHPQGPVALLERDILLRAFLIMMIVVIPVLAMAFWFAWRYRAAAKARYAPNWQSNRIDATVWIVSGLIVASLGVHGWIYTHRLDPYRQLDPTVEPFEVEVVAQNWKWLFLYPGEQVASVNELAFPSDRPVRFRITSDTVMNSFFIPALGSQIYAMPGMQTQLNLRADTSGTFIGRNTQYGGVGFPDQHFTVRAMSSADFDAWVARARQAPGSLDAAAYAALAKPSEGNPVAYYDGFDPGLFAAIIAKYDPEMAGHAAMNHDTDGHSAVATD